MKAYMSTKNEGMDTFAAIFGGKEAMKKRYPATYAAYENTCDLQNRMSAEINAGTGQDSDLPGDVDIEVSHISYTDETKQLIQVDLRAVATDPQGYCILNAYSPQMTEAENALDGNAAAWDVCSDFTGDQEEVSLLFPASYFSEGQNDRENRAVEIQANVYMVDEKVTCYQCSELLNLYGLNYTSTITVDAPKRTHRNQENTDINISYRYKGGTFTEELRDYFYSSQELSDGNLRIPNKGSIKVEGVNLHSISSVALTVANAQGECFCHNNAQATLADSSTITWDIPDNFGNPYEQVLTSFYCYVTYKLEIKAISQGKMYTFVVTNEQGAKKTLNKKIIDKINIYKDCFEAGMNLILEDGSEKKVEDVREGDVLLTPDGSSRVKEIQKARMTTAMVHIKGENGKEASVSIDHPFVTDQGFVCACLLDEGVSVITRDGKTKITELCVTPGVETELYHVTLERGNRLYANGFLTGDSAAELDAAERINNLRYRVKEGWRTDYDSWAQRNALYSQRL